MVDRLDLRHVVALGSSYAAGPGLPPLVDRAAGRSGRNYPHLLADRLGARLTDLTVSGATTTTIVAEQQRTPWGRSFPPQVDGIPADADLVTITAGGNDLRYIGTMIRVGWAGRLRARTLTRPLGHVVGRGDIPLLDSGDTERTAVGLTRVVEAVRTRVPRARVVLVDYLTAIGAHTTSGDSTPFTPEQLEALRSIKDRLDTAFVDAAQRTGAELVRASALSLDHDLGSSDPWVLSLQPLRRLPVSFHPNAAGMEAVADLIYHHVTR